MAKQIDKVSVVAGRLIRVWNDKRKKFSNANKIYFAVHVEDANGKNERCLLFTERELKMAEDRANKNKEDLPEKGFITDIFD